MSFVSRITMAAAALIVSAWGISASAAVSAPHFDVDALTASGSNAGTLGVGDGFSANANILNQAGNNYAHGYDFTLADQAEVTVTAAWFSNGPFGNSLSWVLSGPGGVFNSPPPTFIGAGGGPFPPGIIVSSGVFSGLAAGAYNLTVSGTILSQVGNYDLKVGITPIPGALLLLGPALVGLGYVRYRQRHHNHDR